MSLLRPDSPPAFERHPLTAGAIWRLGLGALVIIAAGWAIGAPLRDATPIGPEEEVLAAVAAIQHDAVATFMGAVSWASSFWVSLVLAAVAVVVARSRTHSWAASWMILLGLFGSLFVTGTVKLLIDRERPLDALVGAHSSSFPSGHASRAVALAGLALWVMWRLAADPRVRAAAAGLLGGWITLVGFSRIYLGIHWPSDILLGFALGACWLLVMLLSTRPRLPVIRARAVGELPPTRTDPVR